MTIKEIEELTGMTRANIRFYEAEGFINPARNPNGYRDYSQQDVAILKKIKLLRSLHISLEEIKELHEGSLNLSDTLNIHIVRLDQQKKDLDVAGKICYSMQQDGVSYQNMNTEKYLNAFFNTSDINSAPEELIQDTIPPVTAPWRRFFARVLDDLFYSYLWYLVLILVFKENPATSGTFFRILNTVIVFVLTYFFEPLQLSAFGTTLGKFILGLSVRDNNDRKLSYKEAQTRTFQVLWHGCGLHLPIYSLFRYWKSYNTCICHDTLPWEYDSNLILKDEKSGRTVIYLLVHVFIYGTLMLSTLYIQNPPNRGELTIEEFCQNYRYLEQYYDLEGNKELNDRGQWRNRVEPGNYSIYTYGDNLFTIGDQQTFEFDTDPDGHINAVRFVLEYDAAAEDEHPVWLPSCQEQMILSALAFISAQDDWKLFSNYNRKLSEQITEQTFQDFQFIFADVTVACDYEYKGLAPAEPSSPIIYPAQDQDIYYYLHFSLEK